MAVDENLRLGAYAEPRVPREALDRVFTLFPRLEDRHDQLAGILSGGEQQMLAMARALMTRPRLLQLDEPSRGLAPVLVHQIFQTIAEINREGTTVLLVEQNANAALRLAHRCSRTAASCWRGRAPSSQKNEAVRLAYLGVGARLGVREGPRERPSAP